STRRPRASGTCRRRPAPDARTAVRRALRGTGGGGPRTGARERPARLGRRRAARGRARSGDRDPARRRRRPARAGARRRGRDARARGDRGDRARRGNGGGARRAARAAARARGRARRARGARRRARVGHAAGRAGVAGAAPRCGAVARGPPPAPASGRDRRRRDDGLARLRRARAPRRRRPLAPPRGRCDRPRRRRLGPPASRHLDRAGDHPDARRARRREGVTVRVAVLSDIHANLHALDAVLEAVDRDPVDRLWCLGDVVGYGPKPNECCDAIRARADVSLCGNHDLAVRGTLDLHEFSGDAAVAAAWTQTVLRDDALEWLKTLEPAGRSEGVGLFHGSARDPVWEYVLSDEAAAATLLLTGDQLVLVGHSHVALHVALRGSELEGALAPGGTALGLGEARWVVNPGSV